MKKAVSLALATVCATSCIVCPANAESQMTGGEALAMMFINEFFAPDEKSGINYSITLDQQNKHFIISAQHQQFEDLCGADNENFEKYADSIMTLFDSVNSLVHTSTGDDEYYMTLTYYLSSCTFEHPYGAYCCFSSKGGTSHRVNEQFVSTQDVTYYVACEEAKIEDIQAIIDFYAQKGCTVKAMSFLSTWYSITVSGEYCNAFLKNYTGKDQQHVYVPEKYIIDAREICKKTEIGTIAISFTNSSNQTFGRLQFSHSGWTGYYYALQDN